MSIRIFPPNQQAFGQFDEGRIVEQKPIGFPGEGSAVERVGTLFYWAWFKTKDTGNLPLHPHRGFEIISYLLQGKVHHHDTSGNDERLSEGGIQVMQTGSGVQHSERYEAGTSGFQIWFEPFMGEANYATPSYAHYEHHELPVVMNKGNIVKTIIGEGSPVHLVADAEMWDVTISSGQKFGYEIPEGYSIAGLVVEGRSIWHFENGTTPVDSEVFAVCEANTLSSLKIEAGTDEDTRVILIQVPSILPYPSYKEVKIRAKVKKQ